MADTEFPVTLHHPDRDDTRVAHNNVDLIRHRFDGYHPEAVVKNIKSERERIAKETAERRAAAETVNAQTAAGTEVTTTRPKATRQKRTTSTRKSSTSKTTGTGTPPEPDASL